MGQRAFEIEGPGGGLKPLPATRCQFGEWEKARVNIDYHIEVERNFYSVPDALLHQEVDVHLTGETVEILAFVGF